MQRIKIVTDSTCDLPQQVLDDLDITMVPLTIRFGQESYKDRVEISSEEFFQRLTESKEVPTTSQVSVGQFAEVFNKHAGEYDSVLGLFLSSKLSGTYQSAVIAKNILGLENIHVMDTKMVTLAHGLIVREAAIMARDGCSLKEIGDRVRYLSEHLHSIIILDTLTYLEKNGRIKSSIAVVGNLLSIKPILTLKNGEVQLLDKIRGRKKVLKWIASYIEEQGIKLEGKTVGMYHIGCNQVADELKGILLNQFNAKELVEGTVGSVIGCYSGPTAIGVYFIREV